MRHPPAYEVRNVSKRYDSPVVQANENISFQVEAGEAFGLLGANGAGKTTIVRQLVGLLRPTSGEIRLFGEVVRAGVRDPGIGRRVAYLPQGALALGELRVEEAIRYTALLRGLGAPTAEAETEELLAGLQLEGIRDRQIRKLSAGQRRLAQLGMTFVGRCPVLILDEPTADIDVALRQRVWDLITDRAHEGAAVILVTHDVAEAERSLQRVAILDRGQVIASGTPAELKARLAHRTRVELVLSHDSVLRPDDVAGEIGGEYRVRGRRITVWVSADYALRSLEKVMDRVGPEAFEDVHMVTPTLADVYLELGGRPLEEEDEAP